MSYAHKTLGEALREKAAQRPAARNGSPIQWQLVSEGIRPIPSLAVDCSVHNPGYDHTCYYKPVWVIEDETGYYPTCLRHSGEVLNSRLRAHPNNIEVAMYFHPYKGE